MNHLKEIEFQIKTLAEAQKKIDANFERVVCVFEKVAGILDRIIPIPRKSEAKAKILKLVWSKPKP